MTTTNTTNPTITVGWVLRNVALYLDRHGWVPARANHHYYCAPLGTLCLDCAMGMVVCGHTGTPTDGHNTLIQWAWFLLSMCLPGVDWSDEYGEDLDPDAVVFDWEDSPGRTVADVRTALHEAADDGDRIYPEVRS
jgi:hypothetical protein